MHFIYDNAIAVLFFSFLVGMAVNAILKRTPIYEPLSRRFLFSSLRTYERIGVVLYRNPLLATPFRWFNNDIRFSTDRSIEKLRMIRSHMINAEIAHWAGFFFMLLFTGVSWWNRGWKIGLFFVILNLLGNLYPSLLQQYNRMRLDKVIAAAARRQSAAPHSAM